MAEPVTHEATDPELWDTDMEIYVLACTCGAWETRGTTDEITAAFEAHLDAEGVPANDLATQQIPEMTITQVTPYNWNPVIIATLATQATDPADKATAYEALHKAQRQLVAEIQAEPVEGLASVAKALRISVGARTPRELAVMAVATILHRERVKSATELSQAVSQLPEILAGAAPELRQALRTLLADAADALAEPDPIVTATGTAGAGANVLDVFLSHAKHPRPGSQRTTLSGQGRIERELKQRAHQAGGRCWCRIAHGQAEAIELNRRAGF